MAWGDVGPTCAQETPEDERKSKQKQKCRKKAETPCYGGFAPRVGGRFQARLAQLWRPCWPTCGAASPLLGHVGPIWALCCPILILCWRILNIRCPILARCWPKKRRNAKSMEKTHGFAMFWHPCRGYVGPAWRPGWSSLGLCWPILGLSWPVLGLCWPILGARLSHLGAMLARLEAMLAQHARRNARRRTKIQTKTKMSPKKPKPHATEDSPRVRPRFPPGWSQVPPFSREGSAAGGASLYNLRLLPKASGKGTGEAVGAGARIYLSKSSKKKWKEVRTRE